MTTLKQTSTKELLTTGTQADALVAADPSNVAHNAGKPSPAPTLVASSNQNAIPIDALVSKLEKNQTTSEHLNRARKRLAKGYYANKTGTLAHLRLQAGLSQSQLAAMVGTSQPHIARIEAGINDPSTSMIEKISNALNIKPEQVFLVILANIKQHA